jgi:aspartyl protease family protein
MMSTGAAAADVRIAGLFSGKALVVVDGGKPRTLAVGQSTPEGAKLVSATSEGAVVEYHGVRQTLTVEQAVRIGSSAPEGGSGTANLKAGVGGHFFANGWINGSSVNFLVDTGATTVAMSITQARLLGLDYLAGTRGQGRTASGTVTSYAVRLDSVRVGDLTLHNVEAHVLDGEGPAQVLLGMTFLARTLMKRDGDTLTLVKRY